MGIKHSKKQRKEQPTEEAGAPAEEEVPKVEEEDEVQIEDPSNPLKIELYPENKPRYTFEKKPVIEMLPKDILEHSLNPKQKLAFLESNVPLLNGFYTAHINHYPIRIKPDDIWLLIVQALSHHINANSERLRYNFVNFEGKQKLTVKYPISSLEQVDKKILENFSEQINEQMKQYLGDELVDLLTPNFSTTTYDSKIVAKISVMGAFKKYFEYHMDLCGCGIPYIILEGTADDYKEIISKAKQLSQYEFDWYIDRIIPHIEKMVEAKEGKIDVDYFKNIVQKKEVTETRPGLSGMGSYDVKVDHISGWFLQFFAYYTDSNGFDDKIQKFTKDSLKVEKFGDLAEQLLIVPLDITDESGKTHSLKYKVGFIGCAQNKNHEVIPVQGWYVSPITEKEKNSVL